MTEVPTTSATRPTDRRRGRRRVIAAACIALLAAGAAIAWIVDRHSTHTAPQPSTLPRLPAYEIAPGAHGDCVYLPCGSLQTAIARVALDQADGATVRIAAGQYGAQKMQHTVGTDAFKHNVVFEPAAGAQVTFDSISVNTAHVTLKGLVVTGGFKILTAAVYSGFEQLTTQHGSAMLAASHSFLRNSTIVPPVDADGIQIKAYSGHDPEGITIENNVVGPTHRGPKRAHVDCLQILGGSDITVRYNRLFHCADQGIIVGSGATGTVGGKLDIERNEVQLCPQRTDDCDGFNAISIHAPSVVFVHNTVIDGGTVFDVTDLTIAGNYIESLKTCTGRIEANVITSTRCTLAAGNRIGPQDFVNRQASPPNLTPVAAAVLPGAAQWVSPPFSVVDINGVAVKTSSPTPGAVQVPSP
ncbi:MAG: hypothetical protein QOJ62_2100 [Actinomycetota bacterium]|nr:hypothetical protein [Actinomycetota bacterium]